MALHSGGSFGDLSALDDCPMVDSTVSAGGQQAGVGLQLRKAVGHVGTVTIKLENIKKERLKTVRDSCPWVNSAPQPPQGQRSSMKLPPIPAVGKYDLRRCLLQYWESLTVLDEGARCLNRIMSTCRVSPMAMHRNA